jgi:hypothetical protein
MSPSFLKIEASPPYTLQEWFQLRREIDFTPPYQRKGGIWSDHDEAFLIDTILNGYDIPKFYLADFGRSSGLLNQNWMSYAIIDGKQRFHAIFEFFNDKVKLNNDFVWRYSPGLPLAGKTYSEILDISPSVINVFEKFVISVMLVATSDPDDIHELFKRLNRGRALTGAEVRNAAVGPVADMVRLLGKHPFFAQAVRFSTLRMNDLNAAAKILLFEYRGYPTSTKKKDLDTLYKMRVDELLLEGAGAAAKHTLNAMSKIFERRDKLLSNSGQVPAFYWFIKLSPPGTHRLVRGFLSRFALQRLETRRNQAANRLHLVDPVLARYDVLDRNTNDAGSQRARISILLEKFADYILPIDRVLAELQSDIAKQYIEETRTQFEMDL